MESEADRWVLSHRCLMDKITHVKQERKRMLSIFIHRCLLCDLAYDSPVWRVGTGSHGLISYIHKPLVSVWGLCALSLSLSSLAVNSPIVQTWPLSPWPMMYHTRFLVHLCWQKAWWTKWPFKHQQFWHRHRNNTSPCSLPREHTPKASSRVRIYQETGGAVLQLLGLSHLSQRLEAAEAFSTWWQCFCGRASFELPVPSPHCLAIPLRIPMLWWTQSHMMNTPEIHPVKFQMCSFMFIHSQATDSVLCVPYDS